MLYLQYLFPFVCFKFEVQKYIIFYQTSPEGQLLYWNHRVTSPTWVVYAYYNLLCWVNWGETGVHTLSLLYPEQIIMHGCGLTTDSCMVTSYESKSQK